MSYSYITKVFPKFEYSNVYDSNLYNNISSLNNKTSINFNPLNEASQYQEINKRNVETYKNIESSDLSKGTDFLSQNNQTYYNKPLPLPLQLQLNNSINDNDNSNLINKTQLQKEFSADLSNQIPTNYKELDLHKESFSQSEQSSHEIYTKHVLECDQCKQILLKQFNIETERIRNEEILELITFLIFGLFILLLLDKK